jgi:hypothetical protein
MDLQEEIARLVDQNGYWQRMDGCNHALNTVTMTDEQRCKLIEVRDDEHRATAESSAIASAIIQAITSRLLSEEAVTSAAMGLTGARWDNGHKIVTGAKLSAREMAAIEARAALSSALERVGMSRVEYARMGGIMSGRARNSEDDFENAVSRALDLNDDKIAREMWSALANVDWFHENGDTAGYSFRAAGDLISAIRGRGNYLEWYCCGPYATVSNRVAEAMKQEGWSYKKAEVSDDQ